MADSPDANLLQRRARRRLVGAIALVVLVVILLPIVLDKEPGPAGQDLVIQIPSQEAGKFKSPVLPPSAPVPVAPAAAPAAAETAKPAPAAPEPGKPASAVPAAEKPVPAVEAKTPQAAPAREAAASPGERDQSGKGENEAARAQALLEGKDAWVVPLGAYSNQDNVKQVQEKLAAAGVKGYTEKIKTRTGEQTRVRAGPFESKAAAESARQKLVDTGVKAGAVVTR